MGESKCKIAPSLLSADFAKLGEEVCSLEKIGADYFHVDVMDGHFVPNITLGPLIVKAIRPHTTLPLDVHLMISEPDRYLENFVAAGADLLTVHAEACLHLDRTLKQIHKLGVKASLALNPHTPLQVLEYVVEELDMILIMTVNPGFGGQSFLPSMLRKISETKDLLIKRGLSHIDIEVDGGISQVTAKSVREAGANVLVAGNAIFTAQNREEEILLLRG